MLFNNQRHISAVISVWENWMIFPKYYTDQLTEIFLKKENGKQSLTKESMDGEPLNMDDGEPLYDHDEVMDDVDGEPLDDVDGEPLDDVDGEPLDDIDGEPVDFDGEPIEEVAQKIETESLYTPVNDMFS